MHGVALSVPVGGICGVAWCVRAASRSCQTCSRLITGAYVDGRPMPRSSIVLTCDRGRVGHAAEFTRPGKARQVVKTVRAPALGRHRIATGVAARSQATHQRGLRQPPLRACGVRQGADRGHACLLARLRGSEGALRDRPTWFGGVTAAQRAVPLPVRALPSAICRKSTVLQSAEGWCKPHL
jgi:hypothetical protein